jgi:hypothetical protein
MESLDVMINDNPEHVHVIWPPKLKILFIYLGASFRPFHFDSLPDTIESFTLLCEMENRNSVAMHKKFMDLVPKTVLFVRTSLPFSLDSFPDLSAYGMSKHLGKVKCPEQIHACMLPASIMPVTWSSKLQLITITVRTQEEMNMFWHHMPQSLHDLEVVNKTGVPLICFWPRDIRDCSSVQTLRLEDQDIMHSGDNIYWNNLFESFPRLNSLDIEFLHSPCPPNIPLRLSTFFITLPWKGTVDIWKIPQVQDAHLKEKDMQKEKQKEKQKQKEKDEQKQKQKKKQKQHRLAQAKDMLEQQRTELHILMNRVVEGEGLDLRSCAFDQIYITSDESLTVLVDPLRMFGPSACSLFSTVDLDTICYNADGHLESENDIPFYALCVRKPLITLAKEDETVMQHVADMLKSPLQAFMQQPQPEKIDSEVFETIQSILQAHQIECHNPVVQVTQMMHQVASLITSSGPFVWKGDTDQFIVSWYKTMSVDDDVYETSTAIQKASKEESKEEFKKPSERVHVILAYEKLQEQENDIAMWETDCLLYSLFKIISNATSWCLREGLYGNQRRFTLSSDMNKNAANQDAANQDAANQDAAINKHVVPGFVVLCLFLILLQSNISLSTPDMDILTWNDVDRSVNDAKKSNYAVDVLWPMLQPFFANVDMSSSASLDVK